MKKAKKKAGLWLALLTLIGSVFVIAAGCNDGDEKAMKDKAGKARFDLTEDVDGVVYCVIGDIVISGGSLSPDITIPTDCDDESHFILLPPGTYAAGMAPGYTCEVAPDDNTYVSCAFNPGPPFVITADTSTPVGLSFTFNFEDEGIVIILGDAGGADIDLDAGTNDNFCPGTGMECPQGWVCSEWNGTPSACYEGCDFEDTTPQDGVDDDQDCTPPNICHRAIGPQGTGGMAGWGNTGDDSDGGLTGKGICTPPSGTGGTGGGSGGTGGAGGTGGQGGTSGTGGTSGMGGTSGSGGTAGQSGAGGTAGQGGMGGTAGTAGISGAGGTGGVTCDPGEFVLFFDAAGILVGPTNTLPFLGVDGDIYMLGERTAPTSTTWTTFCSDVDASTTTFTCVLPTSFEATTWIYQVYMPMDGAPTLPLLLKSVAPLGGTTGAIYWGDGNFSGAGCPEWGGGGDNATDTNGTLTITPCGGGTPLTITMVDNGFLEDPTPGVTHCEPGEMLTENGQTTFVTPP